MAKFTLVMLADRADAAGRTTADIKALAERMEASPDHVRGALDRLAAAGLVERLRAGRLRLALVDQEPDVFVPTGTTGA